MSIFRFKHFDLDQSGCVHKFGTDSMILGALADPKTKTIGLDVGTGSGALALMMVQKKSQLQMDAIELNAVSATSAKKNFDQSPWCNQFHLIEADFLKHSFEKKYDFIICNPPYFENSLKSDLTLKNMARHTDHLPLRDFFAKCSSLLDTDGELWMVFPAHVDLISLAKEKQLHIYRSAAVYGTANALIRMVYCFKKENDCNYDLDVGARIQNIIIRNADGSYTQQYKNLTKEFHGKVL